MALGSCNVFCAEWWSLSCWGLCAIWSSCSWTGWPRVQDTVSTSAGQACGLRNHSLNSTLNLCFKTLQIWEEWLRHQWEKRSFLKAIPVIQGTSVSALLTCCARWFSDGGWGWRLSCLLYAVYQHPWFLCTMLVSSPHPHPNQDMKTENVFRHCQMFPGAKTPLFKNSCLIKHSSKTLRWKFSFCLE